MVRCSLVESTHAYRTAAEVAESFQWLGLPSPVTRPFQCARGMAGASDPVAHNYKGHPWEETRTDRMRQNRDWARLDRLDHGHSRLVLETASFHRGLHGLALAPCSHHVCQGKGREEVPCKVLHAHPGEDIHPARVH